MKKLLVALIAISLYWQDPANPPEPITHYQVFRRPVNILPVGSNWTMLGDVTSKSYVDSTAVSGTTYCYQIAYFAASGWSVSGGVLCGNAD